MAFTTDESQLNGINLDLINQYSQYVNALQPLMLQQSGYEKTLSDNNVSEATRNKITSLKSDQALYDRWINGKGNSNDKADSDAWKSFVSKYYGGTPTNGEQWTDFKNNVSQKLQSSLATAQNQFDNERTGFEMTPEAKSAQDSYKKLAATQLQQLQQQADYLNSDSYKAQVAQQQQIADNQQKNTLAMQQRQQDALTGKIGTSPILQKQLNDSFQTFKEAQNREGNIILGDSIDNAVGKGSAATEALAKFQDNAAALKQRETESIINQTPFTLASADASSGLMGGLNLGNTGQFASTTFNQAYGTPQAPNYAGLSQLTLAGQQPYQNQAQLYMQQQAMQNQIDMQNQARKSGLISGGLQLVGTIGGNIVGGPMGGQIGGQIGQTAGQQFYGPSSSTGYSPQFGQTYSPGSNQLG